MSSSRGDDICFFLDQTKERLEEFLKNCFDNTVSKSELQRSEGSVKEAFLNLLNHSGHCITSVSHKGGTVFETESGWIGIVRNGIRLHIDDVSMQYRMSFYRAVNVFLDIRESLDLTSEQLEDSRFDVENSFKRFIALHPYKNVSEYHDIKFELLEDGEVVMTSLKERNQLGEEKS